MAAALAVTAPAAHAAAGSSRPSNAEVLFRIANPCPVTGQASGPCAGYVVDRIIPAICGGAEDASNMRWITLAEAKAKARWDRIGCRAGRRLVLPGEWKPSTEAFATGEAPEAVRPIPLGPGQRTPPPEAPRAAPAEPALESPADAQSEPAAEP